MVDSHNDPLLGTTIDNRYEIRSIIGNGGMGVVYKAFHQNLEKPVAVKVLTDVGDIGSVQIKRFQTEAVALKELNHNNIVRVYGMGVLGNGKPYIALEYLDGGSLTELLELSQGLSLVGAWTIFQQLADALAHAHERKILHRDVKPGNIMFVQSPGSDPNSWHTKLVDFGISKLMNTHEQQKLTQTGAFIGTPLYMSPEQLGGGMQSEAGDVYSAGCVIYQCLFGTAPYSGDSIMEVAYNQASSEVNIPPVSKLGEPIPAALRALLLRTLEKSPEKRIADGTQLAAWIRKTRAQPDTVPDDLKQTAGRPRRLVTNAQIIARKKLAVSAIVALLSVCSAAAGIYFSDQRHQNSQHDATIRIQGILDQVESDIRDGSPERMVTAKAALTQLLAKNIAQQDLRERLRTAVLKYAERICSRTGVPNSEKAWAVKRALEATQDAGMPDVHYKHLLILTSVEIEQAIDKTSTPAEREAHMQAVCDLSQKLREAFKHITQATPRQSRFFDYAMTSIESTAAYYRTQAATAKEPAESKALLAKARKCLEPVVELLLISPESFDSATTTHTAAVYYDILSSNGEWDAVRQFARKLDKPVYTEKLKGLPNVPKFWVVVANCAQNKNFNESIKLLKPMIAEMDKKPISKLAPEATLYYYYYAAILRGRDLKDAVARFDRAAAVASLHSGQFPMANIDAELGLADVYRCLGNFEEGTKHLAIARSKLAGLGDSIAVKQKYEAAATSEKRINAKDRAL